DRRTSLTISSPQLHIEHKASLINRGYVLPQPRPAGAGSMRALRHTVDSFGTDRRGNIAVIFALALLPVMSAVGCTVDYSRAVQLRSKLQAAADAASVGSIAKTSPAFVAAGKMTSDGAIAAGVTD